MKNDAPAPQHSSNDRNDSSGRKLFSYTTSSYADSLSPSSSPDSGTVIKTYATGKFTPTLENINDIKFQSPDVLPDENEGGIKRYHSISSIQNGALKDFNDNTKSLEDVSKYNKKVSDENKPVASDSAGKPVKKGKARTVSVGIEGQRTTSEQEMPEELNRNSLVSTSRKVATSNKTDDLKVRKNRKSKANVRRAAPKTTSLVEVQSLKVETKF